MALEIQNDELRASEQRVHSALARYSALFNTLPVAVLVVDDYGLVLEANPQARALLALRDVRSHQYFLVRLVQSEDRSAVAGAFEQAKHTDAEGLSAVRFDAADGNRFHADLHIARLPGGDHVPRHFLCAVVDRTEVIRQRDALARAYDALEGSEERYRVLADFSPDWDYWSGPDGRFVYVSPACDDLSGYSAEAFRADAGLLERIVHPDDLAQWRKHMDALHDGGPGDGCAGPRAGPCPLHFRIISRTGEIRWIEHICRPVMAASGRFLGHRGVNRDITQRKHAEAALYELAHKDALTGLANRTRLRGLLEQALTRAAGAGRMLALLFLDLDLLKTVNDTLGHPVGDALLQHIARRLAERVPEQVSVARLGGDEFVVLLDDMDAPDSAAALARELLQVFTRPFAVQGRELSITASIGISVFPADGRDMDVLLAKADVAMYRAKAQGRNTYRFFEAAMTAEAVERLELENALRTALANDQLRVEYQPRVRLADGCIDAAEVLLRWDHPDLGAVPPARFMPIAEALGLGGELGAWVLEHACQQLAAWDAQGCSVPRLAINLSARQLEGPALVDAITATLQRAGIVPQRLELEVTESALLRPGDQASANLSALRRRGITSAVADFGSGFSSLANLKQLPVDRLKLAKAYVDPLTESAADGAIARAIVALGRELGFEVIADGVETEAQAAALRRAGCTRAQGPLYGRPMSARELAVNRADKTC